MRRPLLFAALLLSHSVAAAVGWCIAAPRHPERSPPPATVATERPTPRDKLPAYVRSVRASAGCSEADLLADIARAFRQQPDLTDAERAKAESLDPDAVTADQLAAVLTVSRLTEDPDPAAPDFLMFLGPEGRRAFEDAAGPLPTAAAAKATRRRIAGLCSAFAKLRDAAKKVPSTDPDDRLVFLELVRDTTSGKYASVVELPPPQTPIAGEREAAALAKVREWLAGRHGRRAIPSERHPRLYPGGRLSLASGAWAGEVGGLTAAANGELKELTLTGRDREAVEAAYDALREVLRALGTGG